MSVKYNFFTQLILPLNLMEFQQVTETQKKQLKNIYMLRKKHKIFYFKLTLLLNFQWLYIHPFSQLQTASDGKK